MNNTEQDAFMLEMLEDSQLLQFMTEELMSSSDEEDKRWGGSRKGRAPNKERDFAAAYSKLVIKEFSAQYLNRIPTSDERKNIAAVMETKGFPGCLASWDCKHFVWKNCPMRWAGQYQGHAEGGKKTLILEAIADHRRYLWQVNFGDAGSLNDINVIDKSTNIGAMLNGSLSLKTEGYSINGNLRDWMYFLVDGIYPEWSIFVSTFSSKEDPKKRRFAAKQERVRKDIECAFGIVVQRFHVLQRPFRGWFQEDLCDIVKACTIMHNMIVEERFGTVGDSVDLEDNNNGNNGFALFGRSQITAEEAAMDGIDLFSARVAAFDEAMQSSYEHFLLKRDLVEHIWTNFEYQN